MPISCPSVALHLAVLNRHRLQQKFVDFAEHSGASTSTFDIFSGRQLLLYAKRDDDRPDQIHLLRAFFHQLSVWELEEMDCLYYHLKNQSQVCEVPYPYLTYCVSLTNFH